MARWVVSPLRGRSAAAVGVLAAQNAIIADDKVTGTVRTLLEVAQGVWQPPWVQPHPGLDALKAVTEFGIRIPAAAVDTILALAEPALAEQTRLNGDIAELLLNAYCAVPSRQEDLARAIEAMMRLPDQPDLWMLLRQPPPAHRAVLLPVLRSAADKGVREAGEVLVAWQPTSAAAQLAARRACAQLLRQPIGKGSHHVVALGQDTTTVTMLLGLLGTTTLAGITPDQLSPDIRREAQPQSDATADAGPDQAAIAATAPPQDLAKAVAMHLMALAEAPHTSATSRNQRVLALAPLLDSLPALVTSSIAERLLAISQVPSLTPTDQRAIANNTPFSRVRIDTGARHLASTALRVSALAFAASRSAGAPLTQADSNYARQAIAAAAALLRTDDIALRVRGARCIGAIADSADQFAAQAIGLALHGCEHVRAVGASHLPATDPLLTALAADPSPRVRMAVAARAPLLPQPLHQLLAADPHLAVRRTLARQTPPSLAQPAT